MKLIECRNQEQIINALLIKKKNGFDPITNNDIESIIFLIEDNDLYIGTLIVNCRKNSVVIESLILNEDAGDDLKLKALEDLEAFTTKMHYTSILCKCHIYDSYTYKKVGYNTIGDIFIENDHIYLNMAKKLNKH